MKGMKRLVLRGPAFTVATSINVLVMCAVVWPASGWVGFSACAVLMGFMWFVGVVVAAMARHSARLSEGAVSDVYTRAFHGEAVVALLFGFAPLFWPVAFVGWLAQKPRRYDLKGLGLEEDNVSPVPGDLEMIDG